MRIVILRICAIVALLIIAILIVVQVYHPTVAVLQPKGLLADRERQLIITATLLMLLVVVPVFVMTAVIAWKYRASNTEANYKPDWDGNRAIELTWWAVPCAIIAVLAVVAWRSSHQLDPFRSLASNQAPITIQVVSLDWKWLFIYPQQHVATVNFLEIPYGVPINFELTSDAPMNSFWIPQLSGQIYTMPGMSTQLHLLADQPGDFYGESANISGRGFSGMNFDTKAVGSAEFSQWIQSAQASPQQLTAATYRQLSRPSQNNPTAEYVLMQPDLYDQIIMQYMAPGLSVTADNNPASLRLNQAGYTP